MKRTLLFVLALAVIPVGVDAQGTPSDSCADISLSSALEDVRPCADQGDASAQYFLGSCTPKAMACRKTIWSQNL
jgi:hypothetical protein